MNHYQDIMRRKDEIMMKSLGLDYSKYKVSDIIFDYEKNDG